MKNKIIAMLSIVTIMLCGCSTETLKDNSDQEPENVILNEYTRDSIGTGRGGVFNYTDSETGVCYLIFKDKYSYGGMGGITVRYNADGTIMVKEAEQDESVD